MTPWMDRKFLVVTGKGGVGKTTTAITLALAAARQGKQVCIVEMGGLSTIGTLYGHHERSYAPRALAPGVDLMQLSAADCVDDFGQRKLSTGRLGSLVFRSRPVRAFLDAVPGLADLVQLGKCEDLLNHPLPGDPHYDLMVLDAPATGHGLTLLAAARAMSEMTRVGPFFELAQIIETFLSDSHQTGVIATTVPEELPAQECVELLNELAKEPDQVAGLVINRVRPESLPDLKSWPVIRQALTSNESLAGLAKLADPLVVQLSDQHVVLGRLEASMTDLLPSAPIMTLPTLPVPALGPTDLKALSTEVGAL